VPQIEEQIVHQLHISHGVFHIHLPISIWCATLYIFSFIYLFHIIQECSSLAGLRKIQIISASPRSLCSFDGRSRLFVSSFIFSQSDNDNSLKMLLITPVNTGQQYVDNETYACVFNFWRKTFHSRSSFNAFPTHLPSHFGCPVCYWHALPIWIS